MEMAIKRRLMVSEQNQVIVTTKEASTMMSTACGGPDTARLAGIINIDMAPPEYFDLITGF